MRKGLFDKGYDDKENYSYSKEEEIISGIRPRESLKGRRLTREIRKVEEKIKEKEDSGILQKKLLRLQELKKYLDDEEGWKREKDYGQRWEVEGRFSVFKRLFGEHVFSKEDKNKKNEAILKVNLMNYFASFLIEGTKVNYINTS